jgi:hypothetical protein
VLLQFSKTDLKTEFQLMRKRVKIFAKQDLKTVKED